jgi:DNA-binding SARP family transcriptional activator/streptogramin lyase
MRPPLVGEDSVCDATFKAFTIGFQPDITWFLAVAVNAVRILLLGPVELWVGGRRAALGGPKQRTLLALPALDPGQPVSRDRAAEALWGESLPPGHAQRLHTVVSRLRAALRQAGGSPDVVETTEIGYRLRIDPGQVDAARAAAALHEARELRAAGQPIEAAAAAHDALELWRGPPLEDLLDNGWAGESLRRLEDLKLSLLEEDFDCRLASDASPGLVEELEAACASAPLRERLHAQLILALDASGRRVDALQAYDRVRRRLSEELGIDPGAVLREAHRAVLTEEPDTRRVPVSRGRRRAAWRGRRTALIALVVIGAAAATAAVLLAGGGRREPAAVRLHAGALVIAGPDLHQVRAEIPLSGTVINEQPGGLVLADGSLWSVTERGTVTQVDVAHRRIVGSTPLALPAGPGGMAVGLGATWVTDSGSSTLYRLGSGVTAASRIRLPPLDGRLAGGTGGVAVGEGSIWVVRPAGTVDRLSRSGVLEHRFGIPGATQIVSSERAIWVISKHSGVVTKLDPRTNSVRAHTRLRAEVCCLTVGGGSVWATSEARGLLWQLRPDGRVEDLVHVPAPATELAYADGGVWTSGYTSGTLTRVDAQTLGVRVVHTDQPLAGMAAAPGVVAFSTFASERAALAGVRGPVARILLTQDLIADGDPAAPIVFGDRDAARQRQAATCLSLYEYRDGRLAPYAAGGPGARRSKRRVWTFRVRPGFAFSPPSHERVDAGTFAATIERSTAPAFTHSEAARVLADVVGMHAYRRGLTTHLTGLEATGARLTIRLNRPVATLDARLAAASFCAVPKDTPAVPAGLQDPIPSAGPYYVAGASGGAFAVLRRNPYYPLPNRTGFDAFVYDFNIDGRRALEMLRHGRAVDAPVYGGHAGSTLAAQLGAAGDASGISLRRSPRPGANSGKLGSRIAEFFGRRLGCRSYSPLYAGVELKRLCPVAG